MDPETRETPDSEGGSLGGISTDMESSGAAARGVEERSAEGRSNTPPTKQHRVLISSMTASVRTSCGTRVERVAVGMFAAPLKEVGGGRYVPNTRRRARMCEVSREPASGVVRRYGYNGRDATTL
jgi:hypothetical protein